MTFTEAAAQVLRLVGKPLHYKEITDVAIEKNLLSHVGKSPEVTMGARLAALVKKGDKENPLVRVKPGVFALREWDPGTIERGLSDRTPALKVLEEHETTTEGGADSPDADSSRSRPSATAFLEEDEEEVPDIDEAERERAELAANASELFAAEDDDDEPILGGDDDAEEAPRAAGTGAAASDESQQGRRRRRRR